jgi:SP family myo-inositol transporter-like MFS transporter 13
MFTTTTFIALPELSQVPLNLPEINSKMSFAESKDAEEGFAKYGAEEIEHVKTSRLGNDQSELSSIEATAASKTAWLISIVVSIGGLLFGM